MTTFSSPDRPERSFPLDTGDRVTASVRIGGLLRPQVRRGTAGVVIGFTPPGLVIVRFSNGCTCQVNVHRLGRL